eukprot:983326-Rhodomonas_salina.2
MANKVGGVVVTPPSAGDANKIVVLLGWMGSTDRQLSKYSALNAAVQRSASSHLVILQPGC